MRDSKGYSLLELLIVLLILSIILAGISAKTLGYVNDAKGTAMVSEARAVHHTAAAVLLEFRAYDKTISDKAFMEGLSGTIDDASKPVETRLSQRMTALLAPDVVLSDEPDVDKVRAVFVVDDGVLISTKYQRIVGKKIYTVLIGNGETIISQERAKK